MKKVVSIITAIAIVLGALSCGGVSGVDAHAASFKYSYGVFLGVNPEDSSRMDDYKTIVIDAAYYTKKQINKLKKAGHTVYSYLNVGSIETFRSYYNRFEDITLGEYENWDGEYWMDVSSAKWRKFTVNTLAKRLVKKGVDGFFIDNCDVYYYCLENRADRAEAVYKGLNKTLKNLKKKYSLPIVINGGDTYVKKRISSGKKLWFDAVNQESVFSSITDYDEPAFGTQSAEDTAYYKKYLKKAKKAGLKVYLLEYTTDKKLKKKIRRFCKKKKYGYYISSSLELD
ncbi:MAG: endo alpha-1,4 polygalactosaminidase [Eubacterium sp.]|nr:endo alpha-1,4 polygalactosaminidase [Eubacterium sp.]